MKSQVKTSDSIPPAVVLASKYVPPQERLLDIAKGAINKHPRDLNSIRNTIFEAIRDEPDLLWCMFQAWKKVAVDVLIGEASASLRAAKPVYTVGSTRGHDGRGHSAGDIHRNPAPAVTPSPDGATAHQGRAGQHRDETQERGARPAAVMEKRATAVKAALSVARTLSKLDTVVINGRAIGSCTPNEALAWARSHKVRVRFIEMLTAGVPEDKPIGDFIRPDEADAIWAKAEKGE